MRLKDAISRIRERNRIIRHRESQQKYCAKNRDAVNAKKRVVRSDIPGSIVVNNMHDNVMVYAEL
jgi:hypothetical protein